MVTTDEERVPRGTEQRLGCADKSPLFKNLYIGLKSTNASLRAMWVRERSLYSMRSLILSQRRNLKIWVT